MNYTIEKLEKSKVKIIVDIDDKEFEACVEEAYEKNKHKYSLEGFRKGHVPRKVLENTFGKGVFYEDALDIILPKYYDEVLTKDTSVEPVGKPEADVLELSEKGLKFSVTVAVKPEVKLGTYKGISVKKEKTKITAEQIDAELELARDKASRLVEDKEDRGAKIGDFVTLDFSGSIDGKKFEGGTAEKYDLQLGSGSFIPGFEEQLVGIKVGEEKDVKVSFPKEYPAAELAGKEAVFACKIHAIKIKEMPELNDEFASDVSDFDTLAEYKADIKKQLEKEAEDRAEEKVEDELVKAIAEKATVEIPEEMIEEQIDERLQELEYRLMYQGMKLDDYFKAVGTDKDKVRAEFKPQAEETVKMRLVMEAIVLKENLAPTTEEIEAKIADLAKGANKSVDEYKKTMHERQINYIVNNLATDKLLGYLKDNNKITVSAAKTEKAEKATQAKVEGEDNKSAAKKPASKKASSKKSEGKAE